jgi:hypothetical protein
MDASEPQHSPMLIVACLLITSGDRGFSLSTSRVLRSCAARPGLLDAIRGAAHC